MYELTQDRKTETHASLQKALFHTYKNEPATVRLPDGSVLEYDGMDNWAVKRNEIALEWKYSRIEKGNEYCTASAYGHVLELNGNIFLTNGMYPQFYKDHETAKQAANDWMNEVIKNA